MDMITVEKRDFAVKAKKLRRLGLVPGSVFGGPLREALALQLEEADARRLVEQKREGSKLKIVLDGQQIPVQIKEKAVNLLNNDILHLSFQALQADQKVNSVIHIFLGILAECIALCSQLHHLDALISGAYQAFNQFFLLQTGNDAYGCRLGDMQGLLQLF